MSAPRQTSLISGLFYYSTLWLILHTTYNLRGQQVSSRFITGISIPRVTVPLIQKPAPPFDPDSPCDLEFDFTFMFDI